MKRLFSILFCLVLLGCSSKNEVAKPANLIPEEKMVQILADVHIMESIVEANVNYPDTAVMVYNKRHKEILNKYGVSSDAFYSTYNYYADNLVEMDRLYEVILDTLTAREAKLASKQGATPQATPNSDPLAQPELIVDEPTPRERIRISPRARLSRPESVE